MNREICGQSNHNLHGPEPDGMPVETANWAVGLVANLYNGSDESAETIRYLIAVLMERPEDFWIEFFDRIQPDKELSQRCRDFAASGAYTPSAWREQMLKLAQVIL